MLSYSRILGVVVLNILSGTVSAKCLPKPDAHPECRYPAGDSWCAEKDRANPYAYSDQCLAAASSATATDVQTIRFWNTNKLYANQGLCVATFFFDSGLQVIENLQVSFAALNPSDERVATGTLEIARFGDGSASRYADALAESEHFCDDDLTIVVDQATAIIEGRKVDLLAQKVLVPEAFKPFRILMSPESKTGNTPSASVIEGRIESYICGDNCYLTVVDAQGDTHSGLCASETLCKDWNEVGDMPASFKGKAVKVSVGLGKQFDGEGNVVDTIEAFERIELIQ